MCVCVVCVCVWKGGFKKKNNVHMCMYNSILVGGGGGWGFTKKEERSLHQNYESKTAGGGSS